MKTRYASFLLTTTALPSIARFRWQEVMRTRLSWSHVYSLWKQKPRTPQSTGLSWKDIVAGIRIASQSSLLSVAPFLTPYRLSFIPAAIQCVISDFKIWSVRNPDHASSSLGERDYRLQLALANVWWSQHQRAADWQVDAVARAVA